MFTMRNQHQEETFDKYVTELKLLGSTCNYGTLHDSLIRDRIVCGINNSNLRERLLRTADLTLEKTMQLERAAELTEERIKTLENPSASSTELNGIRHKQKQGTRYKQNPGPDISKYARSSDLTGKNQAGPTMFTAYRSESPLKICSLLRSGNNFLFVGPSNSVFKSRSFLQ